MPNVDYNVETDPTITVQVENTIYQGPAGADGVGIANITYNNQEDVLTIYLTNYQHYTVSGLRGPQGEVGPAGPQGQQGIQGEVGPQGPQGEQGLQGLTGSRGEEGPVGPKGPKGDKGDTGATGLQGEQGPKGDKGDKGDTGATGLQGPKGDTGEKGDAFTYADFTAAQLESLRGPQGIQGPKGDTGDTGPAGSQGAAGADGVGISSVTLNSDYTLTIVLTNNNSYTTTSIRGPQGPKGDTGDTGPQGPQGPAGTYTAGTNITIENGVISAASGGSTYTAGDGIDITNDVISATGPILITCSTGLSNLTKNNCPQNVKDACLAILKGDAAPTQYSFYFGASDWSYGSGIFAVNLLYKYTDGWHIELCEQPYYNKSVYPNGKSAVKFTFDKEEPHSLQSLSTGNIDSATLIAVSTSANLTGSYFSATVDDNFYYIKNNYPKTADLATVATSGSYNDLTDKPSAELPTITSGDEGKALMVNSTGTGVEWGTVSGGATYTAGTGISITNGVISCSVTDTDTTYTAGTGISITNGVISLDLTNANGVSY